MLLYQIYIISLVGINLYNYGYTFWIKTFDPLSNFVKLIIKIFFFLKKQFQKLQINFKQNNHIRGILEYHTKNELLLCVCSIHCYITCILISFVEYISVTAIVNHAVYTVHYQRIHNIYAQYYPYRLYCYEYSMLLISIACGCEREAILSFCKREGGLEGW